MTDFRYEALARDGTLVRGQLVASTLADANGTLAQRGLTPVQVAPASLLTHWRARLQQPVFAAGSFRRTDTLPLLQSLSSLLTAGLTIDRALAVTAKVQQRGSMASASERLLTHLREGRSVAVALETELPQLPPFVIPMVRAGEAGGRLPAVLQELTGYLERTQQLRRRLGSALIYPAVLAVMVLVTLFVVVGVVLPRFEQLFLESRAALPAATSIMLGVGRWLSRHGWWIPVGMVMAAIGVWALRQRPSVRAWMDQRMLGLPIFGVAVANLEVGRALSTLATLLRSGLTLQRSLPISRAVLRNTALLGAFDRIERGVREGRPLSRLFGAERDMHPLAAHLTQVGEETGRLDAMLREVGDTLTREGEQRLERVVAIVIPGLTILMGLVVAAMVSAVLVGVLSVNDLAI